LKKVVDFSCRQLPESHYVKFSARIGIVEPEEKEEKERTAFNEKKEEKTLSNHIPVLRGKNWPRPLCLSATISSVETGISAVRFFEFSAVLPDLADLFWVWGWIKVFLWDADE
jgi:hypothetical protein